MNEDRILDKLDAIDDKADQALLAIARLEEQIKVVPEHEKRLAVLERWKWGLVGMGTLMTMVFGSYASAKGA